MIAKYRGLINYKSSIFIVLFSVIGVYFIIHSFASSVTLEPLKQANFHFSNTSTLATTASQKYPVISIPNPTSNYDQVDTAITDCLNTYGTHSTQCYTDWYNLINAARQTTEPKYNGQTLAPLNINLSNFMNLSMQEQYLVIFNEERIQRNLQPIASETAQLDAAAQTGANEGQDPGIFPKTLTGGAKTGLGAEVWDGNVNPLAADFVWIYDDGYGSDSKKDCPYDGAPGCWGHREGILDDYQDKTLNAITCNGYYNTYLGVAEAPLTGTVWTSEQGQFEAACGPIPTDETVTWTQVCGKSVFSPQPAACNYSQTQPPPPPGNPPAQCPSTTLYINQTLSSASCLSSPSGRYILNWAGGPLYTMRIIDTFTNGILWHTKCGPGQLIFFGDGNLGLQLNVIGPYPPNGPHVCWSTGTENLGGTYATLKDDGRLHMYQPSGTEVWNNIKGIVIDPPHSIYTGQRLFPDDEIFSPSSNYRLILQGDGNLVEYDGLGNRVWANCVNNSGVSNLVLQGDGNLVEYDVNGNEIWTATLQGLGGNQLTIQDNGHVLVYADQSMLIWSNTLGNFCGGSSTKSFPQTFARNTAIYSEQQIVSPTRQYRLAVLANGCIAEYSRDNNVNASWAACGAHAGYGYLWLRSDSELVYGDALTGAAIWSPGISGMGGDYVGVTDSGNVYVNTGSGYTVWSLYGGQTYFPSDLYLNQKLYPGQQMLSTDHNARLVYQGDGNLVAYNRGNGLIWSTGTNGHCAGYFILQGDGNLLMRDCYGNPYWYGGQNSLGSNTSGSYLLWFGGDGNMGLSNYYGELIWSWYTSWVPHWYNWTGLSGANSVYGNPGVSSWGYGRLDVFARWNDGSVAHLAYDSSSGGWHSWDDLGGQIYGGPTAVSWGWGRIDVFVTGTNCHVYHKYYDANTGSQTFFGGSWEDMGGCTYSSPTVTSWGYGRLDIFVRGTNNQIYHRWFNSGSGWSSTSWQNLGGSVCDSPSGVAWPVGYIYVATRNCDNSVGIVYWNGSAWNWGGFGGYTYYSPAMSSWGNGDLELYEVDTNYNLERRYWTGSAWTDWISDLGGSTYNGPAAVSWGPGRIDVFATGTNNAEYIKSYQ